MIWTLFSGPCGTLIPCKKLLCSVGVIAVDVLVFVGNWCFDLNKSTRHGLIWSRNAASVKKGKARRPNKINCKSIHNFRGKIMWKWFHESFEKCKELESIDWIWFILTGKIDLTKILWNQHCVQKYDSRTFKEVISRFFFSIVKYESEFHTVRRRFSVVAATGVWKLIYAADSVIAYLNCPSSFCKFSSSWCFI